MLGGSEMAFFSSIIFYVMMSSCQSAEVKHVIITPDQNYNITRNNLVASFPYMPREYEILINYTSATTSGTVGVLRCAAARPTTKYIMRLFSQNLQVSIKADQSAARLLENVVTTEGGFVQVRLAQYKNQTGYIESASINSISSERPSDNPVIWSNVQCYANGNYDALPSQIHDLVMIFKGEAPVMLDQCACDFRNTSANCNSVRLADTFQYDESINCSFQYPIAENVSVTGGKGNLVCNIPGKNFTNAKELVQVTFRNEGGDFNVLSNYVVYDSNCLDCSAVTCDGSHACTQKPGTCHINGKCYLPNERSPDDACKVCDPGRNMFVKDPQPCGPGKIGAFSLECHELYATATIQKSKSYPNYNNTMVRVSLKHPSCSNIMPVDNADNVTITGTFKQCGVPIKVTNTNITQELQVLVKVTEIFQNIVKRNSSYLYTLQCNFDRSLAISSGNYFNTIDPVETAVNVTSNTVFNAEIDIYTTDSYLLKATSPFQVSSSQPIYIGITESNNNEKFKFIVNRCFATPSASKSGSQYTIIDKKCPIDPTLEIVNVSKNIFQFKLEAFRFIEVHRSIYIHCLLYVCPQSSNSGKCDQQCSTRSRRSLEENGPLKELSITSQEITFQKVKTCKDLSCPTDSKCVEMYPAECVCRDGLVLNFVKNKCSDEHMFKISGLHIDDEFLYTYADPLSTDFRRLDSWAKKELVPLFRKNGEIVGIRIIWATSGSVVLDMLLLYKKNVSMERAIEIFTSTVFVSDAEKQNLASDSILFKVKKYIAPKIVAMAPYQGKIETKQDNKILVVAVAVSALAIMLALMAVFVTMYRRRHEPKSVDGVDNHGMDHNERTM